MPVIEDQITTPPAGGSFGLVNPALVGCDDELRLREPVPYDAPAR